VAIGRGQSRQDGPGKARLLDRELALVEGSLRNALSSDVDLLRMAADLLVRAGGKRLRPSILLLAYRAAGGTETRRAVPLATAVELLHTASLVHDDINDHSELRRGQATINARWGNGLALLVGDFVFVRLIGLLATCSPREIQILGDCCTAVVEGETLQMLHRGDWNVTEVLYLDIVRAKTASLFAACGELGAALAGAAEEQVAALRTYGESLGIAFQIQDDALDLVGERETLGKPVCLDLEQGTMSLAVLYALEHEAGAAEILRAGDRAQVTRLLQDGGALAYAAQRARAFIERALLALAVLPDSQARDELQRLAEYVIIRDR
jgi:octaprenyl-diphosphate synthase